MTLWRDIPLRRRLALGGAALGMVALIVALRGLLGQLSALLLGAGCLCFLAAPLALRFERRLSRPAAALAALACIALGTVALGGLLLPPVCRQLVALARALPGAIARLSSWANGVKLWLERRMPSLSLPAMRPDGLLSPLSSLAGGTVSLAVNLADVTGQVSMMAMLAFFLLCDRDRLLLRLELLLPQACRHAAVAMGNAVCRELRLYLRGQLAVAAAVSLLSVAALTLVGAGNALTLGLMVGLLNMIPYFGPFIGGVPAVLIALGDGWQRAAMTAAALAVVQQLDGAWISPRIMGNLTGFSPAAVLLGVYAGARLRGVTGMLFALPVMMASRTVFRIFVQKYENI